jgi:hypothetical protein
MVIHSLRMEDLSSFASIGCECHIRARTISDPNQRSETTIKTALKFNTRLPRASRRPVRRLFGGRRDERILSSEVWALNLELMFDHSIQCSGSIAFVVFVPHGPCRGTIGKVTPSLDIFKTRVKH